MVTAAVLAMAVLAWPPGPARRRLRSLRSARRPSRTWRLPRPSAVTSICVAATAGWLVADLPGAVAAALLTLTLLRRWRARTDLRRSLTATEALAEAVHSLVAALRAGAHPAHAADMAASDAHPAAAAPMRAISATARLDGDIHRALSMTPSPTPAVLARIARAWSMAQRHGLPLADVLDAAGRDLEQRLRFSKQVTARMAGPRASASVLALLPLLGIAMGEAMGANPIQVLTTTGPGHALLLVGVALQCAGTTWCARLTTQAISR
jgi:tight adherence protein B